MMATSQGGRSKLRPYKAEDVQVRCRGVACYAILSALLATPVFAHEFWIEPDTFRPQANEVVPLTFFVGMAYQGDELPRYTSRIVEFLHFEPGAKAKPVPGFEGQRAGLVRTHAPGLHLVAYQSTSTFVELEPEKFKEYLLEEGLDSIVELRRSRGESDKPGRELFARCPKALLQVGDSGDAKDGMRVMGFPVELIAEVNPYELSPGDSLPIRVFSRGKPLANALVVSFPHEDPEDKPQARTDRDGRATLNLEYSGAWLIKTVLMERIDDDPRADWQSWWGSLTFELPR